ncbi:hypothetical protein AO057_01385 [Curvibacter sp. PAE-UM]|nr:hypothetical protein AO057_01385 [Curvibacter sp. PAE-UM]
MLREWRCQVTGCMDNQVGVGVVFLSQFWPVVAINGENVEGVCSLNRMAKIATCSRKQAPQFFLFDLWSHWIF